MYLLGIKGDNGVWLPHVPELDGFVETSGDDAFVLVGFCVGAARDWLVVRRHLLETVRAQIPQHAFLVRANREDFGA